MIPMPRVPRHVRLVAVLAAALLAAACPGDALLDLGRPERVADGVLLYRLTSAAPLGVPGPIAVQVLRLDPAKVTLQSVLANDRVVSLETVPEMAARTGAIAAINAGFFVVRNGDPAGLLEVGDELVSETSLKRGAVGIIRQPGRRTRLLFDRVAAEVTVRFSTGDEPHAVSIDGVDTTRVRGRLMMYTPRYGHDSDTAPTGIEWQIAGKPARVTARRANAGKSAIPRDGVVLSYGGTVLPAALDRLEEGQEVALETSFQTSLGTHPDSWVEAVDIVGGAGLLIHRGGRVTDWSEERLRDGFAAERHPRTLIGASANGTIWLVTVDGRNAQQSVGMTFAELQTLAEGLDLSYALNLDGGGSTTMVVKGRIVNQPSDPTGPRKVSDGLVVVERQ